MAEHVGYGRGAAPGRFAANVISLYAQGLTTSDIQPHLLLANRRRP